MSATEILVIILATALSIFLVLSIILAVLLIRVTRQIQSVTTSAKTAVDNMQRASGNFSKLMSPAIFFKTIKDMRRRDKTQR